MTDNNYDKKLEGKAELNPTETAEYLAAVEKDLKKQEAE